MLVAWITLVVVSTIFEKYAAQVWLLLALLVLVKIGASWYGKWPTMQDLEINFFLFFAGAYFLTSALKHWNKSFQITSPRVR